jgi:hypothetical protein
LSSGLVTHCDIAFRCTQDAFFQDATVREQLLHFAKSQQANFVDNPMDDTWLQEPPRGPSRNAVLDALWKILNVWRKKMRFNWKGASRRLNPKAARNSPNLLRKRALLLLR